MRTHLLLVILLTLTACADPAAPGDAAPDAGADLAPDLTVEDSAPDLPPAKPLGATCTSDDQCAGGRCLLHPTWPSGYCTLPDCGAACDAAGGVCLSVRDGEPTCAKYCAAVGECRFGYVCHRDWETFDTGCLPQPLVPEPPVVEPPPVMLNGASDGAPCAADADCAGGTCLTGEVWPDGFCTTVACTAHDQCKRRPDDPPLQCTYVSSLGYTACMTPCEQSAECRAGYLCDLNPPNDYLCLRELPIMSWVGETPEATHGLRCQDKRRGIFTIEYDIAPEHPAHSITVVSPRGASVDFIQLITPTTTLNVATRYSFWLDVSAYFNPWLHTLVFPGLPQLASSHGPGRYKLTGSTSDLTICWRVDAHAGQGQRIQVALFLVGRPEVTQLDDLPELASLFARINTIIAPYDLRVEPQLIHLPRELHDAYAYLRSDEDFDALAEQTGALVPPELATSIKLILVRGFVEVGLLGVSGGLPGPPGMQRNPLAGVFASHGSLGNPASELLLAQTIMHELGHYLGLRHTSEGSGREFDPIADTPTCYDIRDDDERCPDRFNLMFPYGGAEAQHTLTPGQLRSLRDNPLIRP